MRKASFARRLLLGATATIAVMACLIASPRSSDAASAAEAKRYVIGSMIWSTSVPFYSNFIKGQQQTAGKLGVKLTLVDGKGDLGTQVAGIQQLIAQRVDAILVTASDAKGIVPIIRKANAAGIPVFAVNNRVDSGAQTVTFIGADDYEFGRQQAKLLVDALGPRARVAYLLGALGSSAHLLREQGFRSYLKAYPSIEIVTSQTANWDAAQALTVVQDWLNKYPKGGIDAIVTQGPEAAKAAKYASEHGRADVKFILGDYPLEVRDGIKAGYILGSVVQDPLPQGVRSIEAAVEWLSGAKARVKQPNEYLTLPIVTRANVANFPPAWGG